MTDEENEAVTKIPRGNLGLAGCGYLRTLNRHYGASTNHTEKEIEGDYRFVRDRCGSARYPRNICRILR